MKFVLGDGAILLTGCQEGEAPKQSASDWPNPTLGTPDSVLGLPGTHGSTEGPFEPRPDTSEGLVNASFDLNEVLEFGALEWACDAYRDDPENRRLKLLCGKSMFFYEGFGTEGIPQPLIDWMSRNFPDELGLGFSKLGLVLDPYRSTEEQPRHLGVGDGALMGQTPTLAHLRQLPLRADARRSLRGRLPQSAVRVRHPHSLHVHWSHARHSRI